MRTDITEYLFHGVGSPERKNANILNDESNESYYPLTQGEELKSEFEVLLNIIKEGGIRATFSYRKGKRTIYGGSPVVCFTEMPLMNVLEYVLSRKDDNKITEYGIAILKKEAFSFGARPVISGLSTSLNYSDINEKILDANVLPISEQYRYVTLDLNPSSNIDWTHEREWRVKIERKDFSIRDDSRINIYETYGINTFSNLNFSECVIVLKTEKEAKQVQQCVQKQLDSGYSFGGQEFHTAIKYLITDEAKKHLEINKITGIETLPSTAFYSHSYEILSDEEKQRTLRIVEECKKKSLVYAQEYIDMYSHTLDSSGNFKDCCGYANVVTFKSENKFVRFLLAERIISCCNEEYIFFGLHKNIPQKQGMTYIEHVAKKQADFLNKNLEDIFTITSRMD